MKALRLFGMGLVCLPLLCSCSSGGESATPTATAATVRPGDREAFGGLLAANDEAGRVLQIAEGKKTAECMKERGFRYTPRDPNEAAKEVTLRPGDVEMARKYGYGSSPRLQQALQDAQGGGEENDPDYAGLDDAQLREWARALGGPAPGASDFKDGLVEVEGPDGVKTFNKNGCTAKAKEAVQGDSVAFMKAEMRVETLTGEVWSRVMADPEWASVQKAWSACMNKRGYSYSNTDGALKDISQRVVKAQRSKSYDEAKLERQEIETAVADAECVDSTRFRETRDALVERHEKAVTAAHEGDIAALTELRQAAVERATEILK